MAGDAPSLWIKGGFSLRVFGPEDGRGRDLAFDRPYALVGRFAEAGVRINDPSMVSNRHAYLHLDRRGLFAVDLASRTGTRVGRDGLSSAWLEPGEALEVAGHRIEVIETWVDPGADGVEAGDPLDDAGPSSLVRMTLFPNRPPGPPLVLGSELIFLGRSPNCGVRVEGASASRIHCVLVRTPTAAFLVDLVGKALWINDRQVGGATEVRDGDSLMVGSARFDVRVEPPGAWRSTAAEPTAEIGPRTSSTELVAQDPAGNLIVPPGVPPLPLELLPAESQAAVMGWMMGMIQANQAEMIRSQDEFHRHMAGLLGEIHRDNQATIRTHLERVEALHSDLSSLREEIGRRFGADAPVHRPEAPSTPRLPPIAIPAMPETSDPVAAADWLLNRVNQLETENKSTLRDLISRLSGSRPSPNS